MIEQIEVHIKEHIYVSTSTTESIETFSYIYIYIS
jgi:hypothetical protein